MKKRTILILLALIVVVVGSSAFLMRKKIMTTLIRAKSKVEFTEVKYESKTMPEIYHEVVDQTSPFLVYGRNDEKIPILEKRLQEDPSNDDIQFQLALQYLYNGDNQKSIDIFTRLEKDPSFMNNKHYLKAKSRVGDSRIDSLEKFTAIAYVRLGEQLNCINNHNDESCVFPIAGSGIHQIKHPVEEAIRRYVEILKKEPEDYLSQWLLNIACQANGSVPDFVPKEYLIPTERILNQFDIGKFNDIAVDLGIDNTGLAGGVAADDFDNDGFIDIISSSTGPRDQTRYFHNNGDGTFTDWTEKSKLTGAWEGVDIDHADYNNDGYLDFLVPRGTWQGMAGRFPPSLMRNNGDGTFTDVTVEAGILQFKPSQTCEWGDFNNDGWLDLFMGYEAELKSNFYLNNHDGTFRDVTDDAGLDFEGFIKGASACDYDNDGLLDLFASNYSHKNYLFHNDGIGKDGLPHFTNVAEKAGVELPINSFICWWFDYNNDGWQDLYVSSYKPGQTMNSCREFMGLPMDSLLFPKLFLNNGNGTFTDVAKKMGVAFETFTMGCGYGDLDNDGWLDFYVCIGAPDFRAIFPNRMFRNNQGKYFQDCTVSGGFGNLQKGHAVAFCDFDYDGDQDVYEDYGGFFTGDVYQNSLYENPGHGNNWINVQFRGVKNNYYGWGAKVKLTFKDNGTQRSTFYIINQGASFQGNPIRLQAGLGKATMIDEMEVTWPAFNIKQVFKNIPVNQFLLCKEDVNTLTPVKVKPYQFKTMERTLVKGDSSVVKKMQHMNMKM